MSPELSGDQELLTFMTLPWGQTNTEKMCEVRNDVQRYKLNTCAAITIGVLEGRKHGSHSRLVLSH